MRHLQFSSIESSPPCYPVLKLFRRSGCGCSKAFLIGNGAGVKEDLELDKILPHQAPSSR